MSGASSMGDMEGFQGAFALMDVRGFGKITLESIFDFVSACPNPPTLDEVTQMYIDFDEDGSGDIDSGEFVGFCEELEKVTNLSAKEMIHYFERKQYQHLFSLVDEDGGGTISVQELKVLVEALHSMLDLKKTAADVKLIMKEYEQEELEFDHFHVLMKRLTAGKSILQVVRAFEEAQRRSKQNLSNALMRFESMAVAPAAPLPNKGRPRAGTIRQPPPPPPTVCQKCQEKDAELNALRQKVMDLEARLSAFNAAKSVKVNIEPRVRLGLRRLDMAYSVHKECPGVVEAALHQARSRRVVKIVERGAAIQPAEMGEVAKSFAVVADSVHKAQRQIAPALQPICKIAQRICEFKMSFLMDPTEPGASSHCVAAVSQARIEMTVALEALKWASEATTDARMTLADSALSLIAFSTNPRKYLRAIDVLERATQELVDVTAIASWFGCDEPSEVELRADEVTAGIPLSAADVDRLIEETRQDSMTFSDASFAKLTTSLKESTYGVQTLTQSLGAIQKRDRGVGTPSLEAILPAEPLPMVVPKSRFAPTTTPKTPHGLMSAPPRSRDIFVEQDIRAPVVDALIKRYLASGVVVPSNFCRMYSADMKEQTRHIFVFGSRRIELFVAQGSLVVKVGGGYMYFEEFCETFTHIEVTRHNRGADRELRKEEERRDKSPNPAGYRSPSPETTRAASISATAYHQHLPHHVDVSTAYSPNRFSKRSESTRSVSNRAISPKPSYASP